LSVPTRTNDLSMCDSGNIEDLLRGALRRVLATPRVRFPPDGSLGRVIPEAAEPLSGAQG
jgi:hypothetical protein